MTFTQFTKPNLTLLRQELEQAVKSIENKHNIKVHFKDFSYTDEIVKIKAEAMIVNSDEIRMDSGALMYKKNVKLHGWKFGITEDMIGAKIQVGHAGFCTLVGCSNRMKKHPIIFMTSTGRLINASTKYLKEVIVHG